MDKGDAWVDNSPGASLAAARSMLTALGLLALAPGTAPIRWLSAGRGTDSPVQPGRSWQREPSPQLQLSFTSALLWYCWKSLGFPVTARGTSSAASWCISLSAGHVSLDSLNAGLFGMCSQTAPTIPCRWWQSCREREVFRNERQNVAPVSAWRRFSLLVPGDLVKDKRWTSCPPRRRSSLWEDS